MLEARLSRTANSSVKINTVTKPISSQLYKDKFRKSHSAIALKTSIMIGTSSPIFRGRNCAMTRS